MDLLYQIFGPLLSLRSDFVLMIASVLSLVWAALAILVGWVGDRRGQSGLGWFVLSLVTSPLVAGLLLVLLTPRRPNPPTRYHRD